MECNKEEALRARTLAEEKMKACDYVGAQKFVTKAQRLFPGLENLLQMITICDVHLSANNKICGLDNWYGILQVEPLSGVETIRKQYRKLALLLHPDKNKFSGAEAAFKFVGEGYRLLSDRIKRSQYDVRYKSHSMLAARNLKVNSARQCAAAANSSIAHTFWTCCKNCGHKYKYLKCYIDTVMHCSTCKKSYIACNVEDEAVRPSGSTVGRKEVQDQGVNDTSRHTASVRSESGSSATGVDKNGTVKGKVKKTHQDDPKKGASNMKPKKGEGVKEKNTDGENPQKCETGTNVSARKKNQAARKRTKAVEESSKSSEVDSSAVTGAKTDTNGFNKSSSPRKKPHVSDTVGESNGDFVSPPTKRTKSGCEFEPGPNTKQTTEDSKSHEVTDSGVSLASSHANKDKSKESVSSGNEDILSPKKKVSEGHDGNEEDAAFSSKTDKVDNGFKADKKNIADPEIDVFEDERKPENFAVNQVWSVRESTNDMPRRYVRVKKVFKGKFKLRVTYLEPIRKENGDENIPVACGKFKNGKIVEVKDRSIFSVQMLHFFNNKIDIIYPRKGEIWALFRDWNEEWNVSLENHRVPYRYDIVEVVSDFSEEVGIGVAYLGKLEGFVSRFHWEAQRGVCQIQFTPKDILRFSHKVPAVKITGNEKEGASSNSYELDPDALPKDIPPVDAFDKEMDCEILKGKDDGPSPEAPKIEVKAKLVPKTGPSPRKRRKSDDDNGICSNLEEAKDGPCRNHNVKADEMNSLNESRKSCKAADISKLRKSPRLQKLPSQQRDEKINAKQGNKMDTPKPKPFVTESLEIRKSPNGKHQPATTQEGESSKKKRRIGELPSSSKQNDSPTQLDGSGSANETPATTPVPPSCKTPRKNAFDFKNLKSQDKFRVNQVWAVYSSDKRFPLEYVKIRKIETQPEFLLRATTMEPYPPSTEPVTRYISCGDFKVLGKQTVFSLASFSHLVKPVHSKKNIVKVYPRKGEIWALLNNCDNAKKEYDIVQVVEEYSDGEVAKAVALTANGSKYIVQKKHGSNAGFIHVPKAEMSRFFRRIPAVKHEKKSTRLVEGGYWELDPDAIPSHTAEL